MVWLFVLIIIVIELFDGGDQQIFINPMCYGDNDWSEGGEINVFGYIFGFHFVYSNTEYKEKHYENHPEELELSDYDVDITFQEGDHKYDPDEIFRFQQLQLPLSEDKKKPLTAARLTKLSWVNGKVMKWKTLSSKSKRYRTKSQTELSSSDITNIKEHGLRILEGESRQQLMRRVQRILFCIVPPIALRAHIIQRYHEKSAHMGSTKLEQSIQAKYKWKSMRKDIRDFCKKCLYCAQNSKKNASTFLRPINFIIPTPFSHLNMDIAFVDKCNGMVGYIVLIDSFSKFAWADPIPAKSAQVVTAKLRAMLTTIQITYQVNFEKCGTKLRHDNGTEFCNREVMALLFEFRIQSCRTNPYSPSENGQAENVNFQIKRIIRWRVIRYGSTWVPYDYVRV